MSLYLYLVIYINGYIMPLDFAKAHKQAFRNDVDKYFFSVRKEV